MAKHPPALPSEWAHILDDVSARLETAVRAADERTASLPAPDVTSAEAVRQGELTALTERLHGLRERGEQARALVDEVDGALQEGEALLRGFLGRAESARQLLAEWTGRAIG
jgi:hypothetical protein